MPRRDKTTNELSEIAQFIKMKRQKLKLTQVEMAQRAGVGLRFIRELEAAKPTLRCDKVNTVLALFGHKLGPVRRIMEEQ